jgi:hypothetical protein
MITDAMQLTTFRDAQLWAQQFGLECAAQEARVADWIWESKPKQGCTWADFRDAHAEVFESDEFWMIAGDCDE